MKEAKNYLSLNDINAYKEAFDLSNIVWETVTKWDAFSKSTVGKQFVRAVDSVSANIAEGFGRSSKKDRIRFYIISRGSVIECINWCQKAKKENYCQRKNMILFRQG